MPSTTSSSSIRSAERSAGRRSPVLRELGLCLGVGVAAALVALFFFTPRIVWWRTLGLPQQFGSVETHRATETLVQLQDPWKPVWNPSNKVIAWRLFFPLIWHYLSLPTGLFLALPQVGCALVLWLVAWLARQQSKDWLQTGMVTTLFATLPWFFVSTGWLTYFDSWLVLGLLLTAFVPSRLVLGLASLITPWIDERFVFALPVTFVVRTVALGCDEERPTRAILLDAAVMLAASLPYPAVRAFAWAGGDADSHAYVQKHWEDVRHVSIWRFLEGLWSGYRAAWVMIGAAAWFTIQRVGRKWGAALAAVVTVTSLGGLTIAADMSRTLMIECVTLLLGISLWQRFMPASFRYALPAVLAANLLLPAEHVIWPFTIPVRYLYAEIDAYRNPGARFNPAALVQLANEERERGNTAQAKILFDTALQLDPSFVAAYLSRAAQRIQDGDTDGALADAGAALRLAPDQPDALFFRAVARHQRGELPEALSDLRRALEVAPAEWPLRAVAEQNLKQSTDAGHSPPPRSSP